MKVKAKKHLGQHFLKDNSISERIVESLTLHGDYKNVLEIGPGTGALTQFLVHKSEYTTHVLDVDTESIAYLHQNYPMLEGRITEGNFLKLDIAAALPSPLAIIGNFPYNISSQILFRVYDQRNCVPEVVGMFQKEVAERVAEPPGSKKYGILSVLLQAFYDIEYLFTVSETVFDPPPKVKSGVIRLRRNEVEKLACDEQLFFRVVKTGFNQRRKTLRNSLKTILKPANIEESHPLLSERPEQLSVESFVTLTAWIAERL